jgi:hypothetical protein
MIPCFAGATWSATKTRAFFVKETPHRASVNRIHEVGLYSKQVRDFLVAALPKRVPQKLEAFTP